MSRHPMPSPDAAWLRMDRAENLMVITSVLWFERPIPVERLRAVLSERLVDRFPRYTQRVADGGLLGGPHWEDAEDFHLDLHVHHVALPEPGGRAELQELVGDLMAAPLDRTKPLWQVWVVDGYDGGGALVMRMHHCIADGIALARVMLSLTDPSPESEAGARLRPPPGGVRHPDAPPPFAARPLDGRRGPLRRAAGPLGPALGASRAIAGAIAREGIETVRHPGRVAGLPGEAAAVLRALAKEVATPADPQGPLRGELRPGERVAWCRPIALGDVRGIAHAHDATVNDVLVAAVTGGLRRWMLAGVAEPVDGLRAEQLEHEIHAMVPFNLRPLDEPLPRELGNRFGLVLLALPLLEADPVGRLREVHRRMAAIKDSPEGAVSYGVLGAMGLSPPAVEAQLIDLFSSKASLVLTNVPGPRAPVYLCGAQLRGVLVWAPCAGSVSTSVSIFSYDGQVTVGFMVDAGLVPDPDAIVAAVDEEIAALRPPAVSRTGKRASAQQPHPAAGG